MQHCDVLIIGGGPAGSTCAARLQEARRDVIVLDRARFPRDKLCAGWVTPAVFEELRIDPADYARGRVLQLVRGFRAGLVGGRTLTVSYPGPVSYAIRRAEFDDYLLRRCGARLELGRPAALIVRRDGRWIVNDRFAAPLLVGAGGHFCPVANAKKGSGVFSAAGEQKDSQPLFLSQEVELLLSPEQAVACPVRPETPEVYFCEDLLGYGWCIRKGDYLNVGLGREDARDLPAHVARFRRWLVDQGRIPADTPERFPGHAYLAYDASPRPLVGDGVLLVGDAAGMAYAQSGEGIRPAVESALMAAAAIVAADGRSDRSSLEAYPRMLQQRFGRRGRRTGEKGPSPLRQRVGRWLLGRRWFVRGVILDRWFLHRRQRPLKI